MFRSYIRTFLKAKIAASGFPANVRTEKEKDDYIQKIKEKYDIHLTKEQIVYNPGARFIAKLCLNCLWVGVKNKTNKQTNNFLGKILFDR